MAEKRYTGAGEFGQGIRPALSSAYDYVSGNIKDAPRKAKLAWQEYLSNPLYNQYPQLLLNPTNIPLAGVKAAIEALGGAANIPINLSDNVLTQEEPENERNSRLTKEAKVAPQEQSSPKINFAKPDLLGKLYGGVDKVPFKRAEAVSKKQIPLNYVVKTYGENPTSEIFTDKKQAKAALKKLYAENKKATMSNVPESEAREFAFGKTEQIRTDSEILKALYAKNPQAARSFAKENDVIKRLRSPQVVAENKARMQEAWKAANEAKIAKDKKAGAGFAEWRSKVKAGRQSEEALNNYNSQLGLLKRAYSQARQLDDPLAAYQIQEYIQEYQSGVPKEMGARKKFAESGALQERTRMLQQKMEEARKQAENERKLAMANPDYRYSSEKTPASNYFKNYGLSLDQPLSLTYQ